MLRRRVLLTSSLYYPNIGGVENSLYHLSKEYRKRGGVPWIITSTGGQPKTAATWFKVSRIHGIPVLRYKFSSIALLRLLRAWMALRILSRKFELDTIVARDQHSALAATFGGRPCVYLVPGVHSEQHKPRGRNPLRWANYCVSATIQGLAFRKVAVVAVFSKRMEASIQRSGIARAVHIVRPGVEVTRFYPASSETVRKRRRELGIPQDAKVGVSVGRLAHLKRMDLAIEALALSPTDWWLVIVGDGPERAELERFAAQLGVADRLLFTGITNVPEEYIQIGDVYLHASDNEAFGQVLLEAMACGIPIAAFDSELPNVQTATNEIVPEQWLFKATEKKAESLCAAMTAAAANDIDPYCLASWVQKHYSWGVLALQLTQLAP